MSETSLTEPLKLPKGNHLVLSSSPHICASDNVRKIMYKVLLALLPTVLAGIWLFGLRALLVIVTTSVACVGIEALWCRLAGKPVKKTILDGSALLTGVILALNLPASVPWYIPIIGAVLAIVLGKQVYGGLGHNPFNPAVVARVGLLIAFPAAMTVWMPTRGMTESEKCAVYFSEGITTTCATPIGVAGMAVLDPASPDRQTLELLDSPQMWWSYVIGKRSGCIGEVFVPALLLGGLLLVGFKLINWRIPVFFVGTVAVISAIAYYCSHGITLSPAFHILTGGLLLGAIFMATDMVTSPITNAGAIAFAIGCGIITSLIRLWGNYPEGVSFAILFMNALVPLLDRWFASRPFGYALKRERK